MAAGDDTGVLAMLHEQTDGFLRRLRPMVSEMARGIISLSSQGSLVPDRVPAEPSIFYGSILAFIPRGRRESRSASVGREAGLGLPASSTEDMIAAGLWQTPR